MQIERQHEIEASPRLTPLIDVVLLLLIFFLLTSNFIDRTSISVTLPESETGEETVQQDVISIAITSGDEIKIGEEGVTLQQLEKQVTEGKRKRYSISADQKASFGVIMDVWDVFRKHDVRNFHIQVRREKRR